MVSGQTSGPGMPGFLYVFLLINCESRGRGGRQRGVTTGWVPIGGALLVGSRAVLGGSKKTSAPSWAVLGPLGPSWGPLGRLVALLGDLGAVLGPSGNQFEPISARKGGKNH